VPSVVLVESLSGRHRTDVRVNRLLKTCHIVEELPERLARRGRVGLSERSHAEAPQSTPSSLSVPSQAGRSSVVI
jgi:hypothetical protein